MNNTIDTLKEQVLIMNKEGSSQNEIANALGSTRDKVRYILEKEGLTKKKTQREVTCKECGKVFNTVSESAKFCQEKCRSSYNRKNRGHKQHCIRCNKSFIQYAKKMYCSDECISEHARWRKPIREMARLLSSVKECPVCKKKFAGSKKYCSDKCSYEYRYAKEVSQRTVYEKVCTQCSNLYSTTGKQSVFCSTVCSRRYHGKARETRKRKVISEKGKVDWDISLEKLYQRDAGICYLCNDPVDYEVHYNDNSYPSIDHVVPISKGGTHSWKNIKLAHRICNTIKRDNILK